MDDRVYDEMLAELDVQAKRLFEQLRRVHELRREIKETRGESHDQPRADS